MIYKFERKLKGANQVEATGEELTINNAGRKVQKFELSGRSKQKARSGYNLANLDADSFVKNGVTVTNNGDGSWTFNGTSSSSGDLILTKNILLFNKIYQFEDTKYLFKTIVVSGSFSNPDKVIVQTSAMGQDNGVDNFATLYNKLSDGVFVNIFNKKSTSHLSRFELYCGPNVTFNNYTIKILFAKTDNKELEWEQYGVSPSPDFPSEIKNVGDNINLLNKDTVDASNNLRGNALDTGRRLIANKDGAYTYGAFKLGGRELLGKTLGIHADIETTGGNPRISIFAGNSSFLTKSLLQVALSASGTGYMTIPSNLNSELDTISAVLYVTTDASVVAGTYVDYTNLKVQVGSEEVVYSAYNCGSLGVTISNRNLFNPEWLVIGNLSADGQEFIQNNYARTKHISVEPNENLSITMFDTTNFRASALYFYDKDKNLIKRTVAPSNVGWDNFSTMGNCKYIRFTIAVVGSKYSTFTEEALQEASNNLQLERGVSTSYIPHEEQKIVFPLTEGQRLYAGSYLAEDGIHNTRKQATLKPKVGQIGGATVNTETKNTSFLIYNNIFDNLKKGQPLRAPLCNKLQGTTSGNYKNFNNQIVQWWDTSADFCAAIQTDLVGTTNDSIASYINNNQFVLEYFLNEEEIIPYTPEQQEIYSQLQNLELFRGCNHITIESNVKPTIKLSYYDGELDMTDYKYNLQFKKHMQEM